MTAAERRARALRALKRGAGGKANAWWHGSWADGKRLSRGDRLRVGAPRGLEDLPRWIAASARRLRVTWDRTTLRVRGSLRGKAREAVVTWLFPP